MDMKISVVIPLYNRERYIRSCVESVLRQTFPVHEIIVIDDGSRDNGGEALRDYVEKKSVRYFYQENQGISRARNAGVAVATGDHIAFLDSDDLWLPAKLEKQVALLRRHNHIEFVHNDADIIDGQGNIVADASCFRFYAQGRCFEEVLHSCGINTSSVLISKRLLDAVGLFDPRLQGSEDYEFFMRSAARYEIGFVDEKLTLYRRHAEGASADRINILIQAIKAVDVFCENTNADKKMIAVATRQQGKLYFRIAQRLFFEFSRKSAARSNLFLAFRHHYFSSEMLPLLLEVLFPNEALKTLRWYRRKLATALRRT